MIFLYIDPGAGSLVIQAVLAAILAVPFFLRSQIGRLVQRMRGTNGTAESGPSDPPASE